MSLRLGGFVALVTIMVATVTISPRSQPSNTDLNNIDLKFEALKQIVRQSSDYISFVQEVNSWQVRPNGCLAKKPDSDRIVFDYRSDPGGGYIQGAMGHSIPVVGNCVIDVNTTCRTGNFIIADDSVWSLEGGRIAYVDAVTLIANRYNVPISVIKPYLDRMTALVQRSLDRKMGAPARKNWNIQNDSMSAQLLQTEVGMSLAWNKYRRDSNRVRSVIAFVYEPGCGFGSSKVTFRTLPPGGRLRLITAFDWSFCQAQGADADPWNTEKCRGWSQIVNEKSNVSGEYYYMANWSDGTTTRDKITIRPSSEDQIMNIPK